MFLDSAYTVDTSDKDNTYYEYNAVVNGVQDTYVAKDELTFAVGTLYDVTVDNDGYISAGASDYDFTDNSPAVSKYTVNVATADAANGAVKVKTAVDSKTALTYNDNAKVYLVNLADKTVTEGDMLDIAEGTYFYLKVVDASATGKADASTVDTIYAFVGDDSVEYDASETLTVTTTGATLSSNTSLLGGIVSATGSTGNTITVTLNGTYTGMDTSVTIDGAGTDVTHATAAAYTLVEDDLDGELTVTVKIYNNGEVALVDTYTIAVADAT